MRDFNSDALLEHLMNDRDLAREILDVYLDSSSELLDNLETAVRAREKSDLVLHSHSLKGASSNVGAEKLTDLASQSEQAAKNGDLDQAVEILPKIKASYEDFLQAVQEEGWGS